MRLDNETFGKTLLEEQEQVEEMHVNYLHFYGFFSQYFSSNKTILNCDEKRESEVICILNIGFFLLLCEPERQLILR